MAAGNPSVFYGKLAGTRNSAFKVPGSLVIQEDGDSSNPPSGFKKFIAKSDGVYVKDSSGSELLIGASSGEGSSTLAVQGTAGDDLSQDDVVYMDIRSTGFLKASNSSLPNDAVLGIVTESGGIFTDDTGEITLFGSVTHSLSAIYAGQAVYLGSSPGQLVNSSPATGSVKCLGYAIDNNTIWFNPNITSNEFSIRGTGGESLLEYAVVYPDPQDSGSYKKATNDGTDTEANAVGITTEKLVPPGSGNVVLQGFVTNGDWSWTPGATLYLGTDGSMTETQPDVSQYIVKPLGYAINETKIWFSPDLGLKMSTGTGSGSSGGGGEASGGYLWVLPSMRNMTDGETLTINSSQKGIGLQWMNQIDVALSSLSIYLSVTAYGVLGLKLLNAWTGDLIADLGTVETGSNGGGRWVRATFETPVQLTNGGQYFLQINGTTGMEADIFYNGVTSEQGSMVPDSVVGCQTSDGWATSSGIYILGLESQVSPLVVLNSDANHLPQLYFGRKRGKSITIPGSGSLEIPVEGLLVDVFGFEADYDYAVYAYDNSGSIAFSVTEDLPMTSEGLFVSSMNPDTDLYVGRICLKQSASDVIPIDVGDYRGVMNAYNKVTKFLGKLCPYRSDTSESLTGSEGRGWIDSETEWKLVYIFDEMSMDTITVTAQLTVKIKGSSSYASVGLGWGAYVDVAAGRVRVSNEGSSFIKIPVTVTETYSPGWPGYSSVTPFRTGTASTDVVFIYYENLGLYEGSKASLLGSIKC
jgi:hypothetical protein